MARVCSVMRTWPHPLTSSPAVKSEAGFYSLLSVWRSEKLWSVSPFIYFINVCVIPCRCLISAFSPLRSASTNHRPLSCVFYRGAPPVVGLEWAWDVWGRFAGWRLSSSPRFWSQACCDWLRSWTFNGSVCVSGGAASLRQNTDSTWEALEHSKSSPSLHNSFLFF